MNKREVKKEAKFIASQILQTFLDYVAGEVPDEITRRWMSIYKKKILETSEVKNHLIDLTEKLWVEGGGEELWVEGSGE